MSAYLQLQSNNLHQMQVAGQELLFHIPSTAIFQPDALTTDIISALSGSVLCTTDQLTQQLSNKHNAADIGTALHELRSLEMIVDSGLQPAARRPFKLDSLPLTTLVLNVNTGCNLSCSYCYKEDLDVPSAGKKMEFETAKQSIDMLLKESPDQSRYNIVFFGGEPLTNMPLIREVIEYAEPHFAKAGKVIDFSLTTNATLLTDKVIRYLNDHNVGIAVSIDGPKALHDRNRITVGGKGTYQTVAKKVERLFSLYNSRPVGARVTLTRGITDVEGIWDHLFNDLGFHEVGFAPVTSGDISDYNLSNDELINVFDNMKSLGKRYLEAALENRSIGFSNLHQLMTDLHEGSKKALPCGAGVGMVAIDYEGGVNLCHRFTGSDLPLFGSISEGIDKPALNQFINERMEKSEKGCSTCHIRNLCAGGCYHESYARYNEPTKPTFHYCDLMRDWVDFGIGIYTQIMAKNPGFYDTYISPRRAA
jgi:uncharacterized protein